jgi:hypothetical protein
MNSQIRSRTALFLLCFVAHLSGTYLFALWWIYLSQERLFSGGPFSPELHIVGGVALVLSLPALLPCARLVLVQGFLDPIHDVIYLPLTIMNSIIAVSIVTLLGPWLVANCRVWWSKRF